MSSSLRSILNAACVLALFMLPTFVDAQTYVYVNANTTSNAVWGFQVSPSGALTPISGSPFSTGGGGDNGGYYASRRIAVSPNGFLYASNSATGTISPFSIDTSTGQLTLGSLTSMPGGGAFLGISLGITGDGRFLIAAGVSYAASYSIGADGSLTLINTLPVTDVDGLAVAANGSFAAFAMPNFGNIVAIATIDSTGHLAWGSGSPLSISVSAPTDAAIPCTSDRVYFGSVTQAVPGYSVDSNGALTALPGSPYLLGGSNQAVTITPDGSHLYANDFNPINAWEINNDGSLTPVPGAPFNVGFTAYSLTTSSDGSVLFSGGFASNAPLSMLIGATGAVSLAAHGFVDAIYPMSVAAYPPQCGSPSTNTTTSISAPNVAYGADGIITVTVSANSGSNPPSGNVSLTINGGASIIQPLSNPVGASASSVFTITQPNAGTYTLHADFAAQHGFAESSADGSLTVGKSTPIITWANPADIAYPTALSSTQLNATANVPGTFVYSPAAGTVLKAGQGQTLSVTFTPTDTTNYTTASKQVTINVNKATPTITWANPADITYPTALSATQLNAMANVPGTFVYSPAAGTVLKAGQGQTLSVTFTPTDTTNYTTASKQVTINVNKATPTITWATPVAITYGTALSATQLDATANVTGTFVYVPPAGTVLNAGTQMLSVTFTPTDMVDYTSATKMVSLTVNRAALSVSANPAGSQYSDPLAPLTYIITGFVNGENANVVSGGPALSTTATQYSAPGTYVINISLGTLNAANYYFVFSGSTYTILQEDARDTYTGDLFASTSSATSGTATVTLSATIQDITAVPSDPAYDPYPGDIRNATVSFVNRDAGNAVLCAASGVGLVNASNTEVGTVTCNWSANIGNANSVSYTVGIVIGGYYTRNKSADDTVVTVSRPLTSQFITGGGYLVLQSTAGLLGGINGSNDNFGFNVKYNAGGTNLQGNINVIVRSNICVQGSNCSNPGPYVYQVKGNSMTSLSVQTNQATFNGKASIQDITNPLSSISIDGNASLQVNMTDSLSSGTPDTIGITVWNKAGGLWFSSNWNGTRTVQQNLAGDVVVH